MKKLILANAVVAAITTFGAFSTASAASVTGNANVTTDYKFRGISQTNSGPAFQGGFDVGFDNGFYLGNWNSNVNFAGQDSSAGLEMDFYGGYASEINGIGYDVGVLQYFYEGVKIAPGAAKLNTTEVYGKLSYKGAYAKVSYAVSDDYFGLTAANGSTKFSGSTYTEAGYTYALNDKISFAGKVGYTSFDKELNTLTGSRSKSYTDYSVGATYAFDSKYSVTAAYVDTNKNAERLFGKDATEGSAVVTFSAKF